MIRCFFDPSVVLEDEDSKCAKCCIHCDDKDCEERCAFASVRKTEDRILADCIFAEE